VGQVTHVRVRGVSIPAMPGSYFYVYMPHLLLIRRYHSTLAPLSWWKLGNRNTMEEFMLLLDRTNAARLQKLRLNGPYGKKINYNRYKTIMLVADGIGIASVLSFAISLISKLKHDREDQAEGLT
jgi:NAD(P)H-flavin reductase